MAKEYTIVTKKVSNPFWKYDETEDMLADMESKGYRLIKIRRNRTFYFKESKQKDALYFITYNLSPRRDGGMAACRHPLLSKHLANEIPGEMTDFRVFRITGEKRDLDDFRLFRANYILSFLRKFIIIPLILTLLSAVLLILSGTLLTYIASGLVFAASFIPTVWAAFAIHKMKAVRDRAEKALNRP